MRRAQKKRPDAEALGRSQGGFSTKVHVRAEGHGKLMTLVLTPGHRHEAPNVFFSYQSCMSCLPVLWLPGPVAACGAPAP
jgi:hypothetical protein